MRSAVGLKLSGKCASATQNALSPFSGKFLKSTNSSTAKATTTIGAARDDFAPRSKSRANSATAIASADTAPNGNGPKTGAASPYTRSAITGRVRANMRSAASCCRSRSDPSGGSRSNVPKATGNTALYGNSAWPSCKSKLSKVGQHVWPTHRAAEPKRKLPGCFRSVVERAAAEHARHHAEGEAERTDRVTEALAGCDARGREREPRRAHAERRQRDADQHASRQEGRSRCRASRPRAQGTATPPLQLQPCARMPRAPDRRARPRARPS